MSSFYRKSYTRKPTAGQTGCICVFFGLFLVIGLVFFYAATVRPILRVAAAQLWKETPCVVDASSVVVHQSSSRRGGNTYSIEVDYHYTYDERVFHATRYRFNTGSSSGRAGKQRVVDQYPRGRQTVCYVNPRNPAEAVIDRGLNFEMFFGSFALIFAFVGGGGIYLVLRGADARPGPRQNAVPTFVPASGEPVVLKPETTPLGKFLFVLAFATVWNGFIGIFGYLIFFAPSHSDVPIFAKIFVGLFAGIGLILIAGVFGSFFALFNPRVRVSSRANSVPLGGEFQFQWSIGRHAQRIRKLRIAVEGCEQTTERRGKHVHTATQLFARLPVFETIDSEIPTEGQGRVVIPAGLMHTFNGRHNKIIWRLRIHGDIPGLPAVVDVYQINVLPHRVAT